MISVLRDVRVETRIGILEDNLLGKLDPALARGEVRAGQPEFAKLIRDD
jgi:hypothetical protein